MYVCVLFLREGGIGVVGWCFFFRGGLGLGVSGFKLFTSTG